MIPTLIELLGYFYVSSMYVYMYVTSFYLSLSPFPLDLELELERHSINYSLLAMVFIISPGIDPLLFLSFDGEWEWDRRGVSDENNIIVCLFFLFFLFLPFPSPFNLSYSAETKNEPTKT